MVIRCRVTIKQVAEQTGVSTQTVSRVINGRPDVAAKTRQRVLEAIEQLGYQPNALARSLIRRCSHTLGVVTAGLTYIGPAYTLNGITDQAEVMGYSLLLKVLPSFETDEVIPILDALLARQVDGIIWAVSEVGNNHMWMDERLPALPVPIIFLTMHPQPEVNVVAVDNYMGGRMATEHLLQQGYRRIGHIAGPLAWWESRQRMAGWRDALTEAGISACDSHWVEGDWSPKSGEEAIQCLLEQYPDMDAVFVANDQMAFGVLSVACRRGVQIPRELAVVGFDGIPETAYLWPPLTTVHQDLYALGRTAVLHLVAMIEASHHADQEIQTADVIWLKPQLIVRESSLAANHLDNAAGRMDQVSSAVHAPRLRSV